MTDKPFQGVIYEWRRAGDMIVGKCRWHMNQHQPSLEAVLRNDIIVGGEMRTSKIVRMEDRGSFVLCETRNSFYALIEPSVNC